jgi:hypothetical protein
MKLFIDGGGERLWVKFSSSFGEIFGLCPKRQGRSQCLHSEYDIVKMPISKQRIHRELEYWSSMSINCYSHHGTLLQLL